jgi:cobalt/nickel transport system ATP-binding protein
MADKANNIFELREISYCYPNDEWALKNIDISIPKGAKVALIGENGAGKSTLMLLLNGILKPTNGSIQFENELICHRRKALRKLHQKVGFLFPNSDDQLIAPTVYEEISFGLMNLYKDENLTRKKTEEIIAHFDLKQIQHKSPHQLSSGQKKMVCLAAILAMEPEVIICDEPASHLDYKSEQLLFEHLDRLNKMGKTIIISTHNINQAYEWTDETILLHQSQLKAHGKTTEVLSHSNLLKEVNIPSPTIISLLNELNIDIPTNNPPKTKEDLAQLIYLNR